MLLHVAALNVGHFRELIPFFSICSLCFNMYGGDSTYD